MTPRLVAGSANAPLAARIAAALGIERAPCEVDRFPDGEIRPVVSNVRGGDVYVVQPIGAPVAESLVELLLLLDACRRAGAARITAVVPYLAYARQDRRTLPGESVGAHVVAEALGAAGADRLIVLDPHTAALEAMFRIPVETVTAVPALAAAARPTLRGDLVVVAPDIGAAKLAERYAAALGAPVAIVRKTRVAADQVRAEQVVGDVAGRRPVIVDDMISTGGTIEAAARALAASGAAPGVDVIATHGLFAGRAVERLAALPLRSLLVTDSLQSPALPEPFAVCSIAGLLADAIGRLNRDEPVDDLLLRG